MKKAIFPFLIFSIFFISSQAQIGIGTSNPDKSAVLDVSGNNRGFLVPRMSASQRKNISTPAKGLMVFDNDSSYFFYYDGAAWKGLKTIAVLSPWHKTGNKVVLNTATDSVGVGKTPQYAFDIKNSANVDSFYMISGQKILNIKGGSNLFIGQNSGKNNSAGANQFSGYEAGLNNTAGDSNYFSGFQAGHTITSSSYNHFEGYKSGYSNTTGSMNYFSGQGTGFSNTIGSNNYFSGNQAGYSNTSGSINYFSGFHAGYSNTTGATNMFIGFNAGFSNTTGNSNYFFGPGAGYNNTSASSNFFEGLQTGFANTTGNQNFFIGHQAGSANTTGSYSEFVGFQAGNKTTSGGNNCFIGYQAGYKNTTGAHNYGSGYLAAYGNVSGNYNCSVGDSAGANNTGNNNTFVGYHADGTVPGLTNAAAFGSGALVSNSNTMVFGNGITSGWAFGITALASGHALEVGSSSANGNGAYLTTGGTWTNASDRNKKENFSTLDSRDILNRIAMLKITSWNYKGENAINMHIGPMAQDFYKLFKTGNDSLSISTIDPAGVALVGIQQLKKENEDLKTEVENLKKANSALQSSVLQQSTVIEHLSLDITEIKGMIKDNQPHTDISKSKSH